MINGWLQLTDEQRKTSIEQAAVLSGITAKAIEKDWWVTLVLKALFATPIAAHFIFKGGTSLSKGWKLIQRLSEDIDIGLAPEAFGREYKNQPTHSYVKKLKREGCAFTSTVIKDALHQQLLFLGVPPGEISIEAELVADNLPDKDPQTIFARYRSLYPPHPYLADEVKIEFSVRSLRDPYADVNIQSILHEIFPNKAYEEVPFIVSAVEPRKTLLEKLFLLHEKFSLAEDGNIKGERQSRHLYDVVKMRHTAIEEAVLQDHEFYATLLEHRRHYIRIHGIEYEEMRALTLSFVPPEAMTDIFREDYEIMRVEMIYGESPEFETIMEELRDLNEKIAQMQS